MNARQTHGFASGLGSWTAASALVAAALLLLLGIGIIFYGARYRTEQEKHEATTEAQILASSVSAALEFDDPEAAQEFVNAMRVNPNVEVAGVYQAGGGRFAVYARSGLKGPSIVSGPAQTAIEERQLNIVTPVTQNGRQIGWVYLRTTITSATRRLVLYGLVALLITMASLVVAVLGISQRALAKANTELEARARELTAANSELQVQIREREKAEAALWQAQKMEAIGQLTGGVAHDFNNLLQVMLGSIEALERWGRRRGIEGDAGKEFQRLTGTAMRGGERAAVLTQQLLAFARRQPLDPKPTEVNALIIGMSELLRGALGELIVTETILADRLWPVFADRNQLENAILNLAVNSRDAMPDGGRLTVETANVVLDELSVRDQADFKPGEYVVVAVTDTGSGMSDETAGHAFEPFFTTKEVGRGTGLGLSQVYGFIKQTGGHVKLYSALGCGTTVRLYLPHWTGPESGDEDAGVSAAPPSAETRERVLVVEDEESARALSVEMLREIGFAVFEASDSAEAMRVLDEVPAIRLLLADLGLSGKHGGPRLVHKARRKHSGLKVLYTTNGAPDRLAHDESVDSGVPLLRKPFTFRELSLKTRQVLEA